MEINKKGTLINVLVFASIFIFLAFVPYLVWGKEDYSQYFWYYIVGAFFTAFGNEFMRLRLYPGVARKEYFKTLSALIILIYAFSVMMQLVLPGLAFMDPSTKGLTKNIPYFIIISAVTFFFLYYNILRQSFRAVPYDYDIACGRCLFLSGTEFRVWPFFVEYKFKKLPKNIRVFKENIEINCQDGVLKPSQIFFELNIFHFKCTTPKEEEIVNIFWSEFLKSAKEYTIVDLVNKKMTAIRIELKEITIEWPGNFKLYI